MRGHCAHCGQDCGLLPARVAPAKENPAGVARLTAGIGGVLVGGEGLEPPTFWV